MIIKVKQSLFHIFIDWLIALVGWGFLLTFFYIFINHLSPEMDFHFYFLNLNHANAIVSLTLIVFILATVLLYGWRTFNKRKYGSLKRRKPPSVTSQAELANFFEISAEDVVEIQEKRFINRN